MATTCTRCDGTGFLNVDQIDGAARADGSTAAIEQWIATHDAHDVAICDCCGDGEHWYGSPGEHYGSDDPPGDYGPYGYNGGLCECH